MRETGYTQVQQIQTLIASVINDNDPTSYQVGAAQLQIDSHLEAIDRMARTTTFQGVPLFSGLLDAGAGGLLLDIGRHNPLADPTRIYIPGISTATLQGPAGKLFQIRSGGDLDLDADADTAMAVAGQTLEQLHGLRVNFAQFSGYHGADVVLIPDLEAEGYRLAEIQSDEPVGIADLAEARSVLISPDETFVCLSGFPNGSTAVFRLNPAGDRPTFLELLCVGETQPENPLLVATVDGVAEVRSALEEIAAIVSALAEGNYTSDDDIVEQQARVDRLLDKIDEIASAAAYDGTPLLDGSLDISAENVDGSLIHDLQIHQAALVGNDLLDVRVNVVEPATRAMLFYEGETLEDNIVLEIGGVLGYEACNFTAGTTIEDIAATVNLLSQSLGVEAVVENGTTLVFRSTDFGRADFVSVKPLAGRFAVADSNGDRAGRQYGTDANVTINGLGAEARGFDVVLATAALDLRFTLDEDVTAGTESTFQVASNALRYLSGMQDGSWQYTSLGIYSLKPADLGGEGARLSDLHSTGVVPLDQNPDAALAIVTEVEEQVRRLEVRLDVLARGESAVSVVVAAATGGWSEIDALPDADPSKRTTPLLAAADNGLASISVMLHEVRDISTKLAGNYYYNDPLEGELQQLRVDMLLQAIRRAATSSAVDYVAPLDGRFRLAPAGLLAGQLHNIEINHVDFDGAVPFSVDARVVEQATRGRLIYPHDSVINDVVLEIGGPQGTECYYFAAGSNVAEMAAAINLLNDDLGVTASLQDNIFGSPGLVISSNAYGSDAFVSVEAIEGIFDMLDTRGNVATRNSGSDADVLVNGMRTVGNGLGVALNSPQLGLSFVLDAAVAAGSDMYFVILHGGAQLEPSPGVPSGPVPALGIIDARSLGMDGIDAAISTALRQRGRLAIFERDVLGIDWTPDRPPTTSGIDDVVVSEGAVDTVINLFSAFEDDRDADAELTYSIIENTNPGLFDATTIDALAGTLTLDYGPDDGTAQITVEATDTSGQSVATTFSVIISNVAPSVIAIDMRDVAVRSQTLEYAASFVDAGIADTHAASIDWGDGSPLEQVAVIVTSGAGAVSGSHAYATAGVYTVLLTIEDDDGGRAAAQHQIIIKTATVLDDPERPGQQALFVGGTLDNDRIFISQFFNTFVSVYIAPQRYWRFFAMRNDQHVYVYAGEGNDHVRISANNRLDAMVFGGPGNDRLHGGRGNDILDGGPGNDRLYGNSGNDILLGGAGRDRLFGHGGRDLLIGGPGRDFLAGSSGDDILIGGTTSHDTNHAALAAVMAEWTSPRSINARIGHLRNGGGLNGSYLLKIHETIFDDDKCDLLWGARGRDWFVFFESDYCFDQGRRDR